MPVKSKGAKSIFEEAKRLREKYPHRFKTWREYVAQASAIYASKHGGKSPIGKKRKKTKKMSKRVGAESLFLPLESIGRITVKSLKDLLKREKMRLRHGYELVKRKRLDGVSGVGYITNGAITNLVNHYLHVYWQLEHMIVKAETEKERRALEEKQRVIERHIDWANDFYDKVKRKK